MVLYRGVKWALPIVLTVALGAVADAQSERDPRQDARPPAQGGIGASDVLRHRLLGEPLPNRVALPPERPARVEECRPLPDRRGVRVGTFDARGPLNDPLTIDQPVGRFFTREAAILAGQQAEGPAVVLAREGGFDVYTVDDHRRDLLTLGDVALRDGRTRLDTGGAQTGLPSALVLEDGVTLRPLQADTGRPARFVVDDEASRLYSPARVADEIAFATRGAGTREPQVFEALANMSPGERELLEAMFASRHGESLQQRLDRELGPVFGHRRLAQELLEADGGALSRDELRRDVDAALEAQVGPLPDTSRVPDVPRMIWFLGNFGNVTGDETVATFTTGNEWALKQAMAEEVARRGERLSPGQVLGLSLALNDGDRYRAVLTAHNTLRAMARGMDPAWEEQVPARDGRPVDRLNHSAEFMREHLRPIRGGGDERGAWYHLFGVATLSMAGGGPVAKGVAAVEEYVISRDAYSDPLEWRVDKLGAELGNQVSRGAGLPLPEIRRGR